MDELFEFHHAIILLHEAGGETLRVVASRGYENQAIGGRVRVGIGAVGIVAERRKILQLDNLGQQRAYASAQRRQMMQSGRGMEIGDAVPVPGLPNAESQIAIPLLIRDELVGVFSIESPLRQAFDEHDRSLVTIVANQIASAIRNAQLYDERRRAAEALQAANASLEMRVAERTEALERELRVAEDLLRHMRSRVDGAADRRERAGSRPPRSRRSRGAPHRTAGAVWSSWGRQGSGGPRRCTPARAAKARSSSSAAPSFRHRAGRRRAARTREHERLRACWRANSSSPPAGHSFSKRFTSFRSSISASCRRSSTVRNARAAAARGHSLTLESSRRRRGSYRPKA